MITIYLTEYNIMDILNWFDEYTLGYHLVDTVVDKYTYQPLLKIKMESESVTAAQLKWGAAIVIGNHRVTVTSPVVTPFPSEIKRMLYG